MTFVVAGWLGHVGFMMVAVTCGLVAATWYLFAFIIIATYTANLAAYLTVSKLAEPVKSLEDLEGQYKIQ